MPRIGLLGLAAASLLFCAVAGATPTPSCTAGSTRTAMSITRQAAPKRQAGESETAAKQRRLDDAAAKAAADKQAAECKGKTTS